jgi:Polysaccharide pyruvyl transferase.
MKVGLLTYWWSKDNYGQQLQLFALYTFLKNNGYESFVIRYDMRGDIQINYWKKIYKILNPLVLYRFAKNYLKRRQLSLIDIENPRNFEEFQENVLLLSPIYNTYKELKENPPEADIYIVGSDQIWNINSFIGDKRKDCLKAYFLDFGNSSTKRMSYAASWGPVKLDEIKYQKIIEPLLKKFYFVSVREKNGLDICKKIGINNVHWVCDPTLLLSAEDYRSFYNNYLNIETNKESSSIFSSNNKYIFFYYLNNGGYFDISSIYEFAKEKGLKVIYITANGQTDIYPQIYPNIYNWLELLDHATYVVTNSFHCSVFSIIFHKQFAAIPITGNASGMNARLESLFEICSMEPRLLSTEKNNQNFNILEKEYTAVIDNSGGQMLLKALK